MNLPVGNEGPLNGATAVTALAAPAAAKQRVIPNNGAGVFNVDTVAHDFTFQKNKAGTLTPLYTLLAVAAGQQAILPKRVVLDATDESLEVFMEGAHTTTAPRFDVAAMETS
jgi:hypothetical protein